MPERPWLDELVTVTIDIDGRLLPGAGGDALLGSGVEGIGRCARDTVQCFFPIDQEEAIRIARTEGLEEGVAPWKIDFSWRRPEGRFVWSVTSTLRDEGPCNQAGRTVLINANTGQVSKGHAWVVTCSH